MLNLGLEIPSLSLKESDLDSVSLWKNELLVSHSVSKKHHLVGSREKSVVNLVMINTIIKFS